MSILVVSPGAAFTISTSAARFARTTLMMVYAAMSAIATLTKAWMIATLKAARALLDTKLRLKMMVPRPD